ncbi:putative ATP-dependent DNA ligase [Anopheles sinensis]|uniref:Putative ATP-dependent DNA ligase n=1 Tax=Anopheles sinensis TaxID=74873 RepID=A0A084WH97_ANOSI|nr:putative ATP-dependent DNA ligase [Anopheles sinensis]
MTPRRNPSVNPSMSNKIETDVPERTGSVMKIAPVNHKMGRIEGSRPGRPLMAIVYVSGG